MQMPSSTAFCVHGLPPRWTGVRFGDSHTCGQQRRSNAARVWRCRSGTNDASTSKSATSKASPESPAAKSQQSPPAGTARASKSLRKPALRGKAQDDGESLRLGTASSVGQPVVNAAIMQAMGDYFGDDGREVEEYLKHPRDKNGEVMLRVLLVGSGPAEIATAKVLEASSRVRGLYYCPDVTGACELAMEPFAHSCTVGARDGVDEIMRFSKWASVDAIFVGPERADCLGSESEALFASEGITVFPHDVSAALADGSLSVGDCFASLGEEFDPPSETLVE